MGKAPGTILMSPIEDHLARALSLAGWSHREIGLLLGRSGKAIGVAVERAESGDYPLLALSSKSELLENLGPDGKKLLRRVSGFLRWVQDGEENGYVAALVQILRPEW